METVEEAEAYGFTCRNPLTDQSEQYSIAIDYFFCYFVIFSPPDSDFAKMKRPEWERLNAARLTNSERSVVWKLWHNAGLNYKIVQAMGLMSNGCGSRSTTYLALCEC